MGVCCTVRITRRFSSKEKLGRGGDACGGMWCRTIVAKKKKKFLLPILIFEMGSAKCCLDWADETFGFRICSRPLGNYFSMTKAHLLHKLGKRSRVALEAGGSLEDVSSAGMPMHR